MNHTLSTYRAEPPVIAGDWEDSFALQYAAASQKNRERRRGGKRAPLRNAAPADAHQDERSLARDVAIERARSLADIKRLRQAVGYRFFGGAVGGNPLYARQGFVFRGLVSDEAPILKLFATKTPRARRLLTGGSKNRVDGTDSKLLALDSAYVTTNARMRGVIRVDIDARLDSWAAVSVMCDKARIPLPNVAVGHVDTSGQVLNPHLIWIIANSVAFTPKARKSPQRLFLGVQRGLTAALVPHGADPGGLSNALHMKNPLSPVWGHAIFCPTPYHLTDLRTETDIRLPTSTGAPVNRPAATTSVRSNRAFWDLCTWARRNVMSYRPAGLFDEFFQDVEAEALRLFITPAHGQDRAVRSAQDAAGRVSRWTWDTRNFPAAPLPPDELRRRQTAAGQATVAKRRSATETAIIEAAKTLAQAHGTPFTQSALVAATGKSERTIRRHWPAVRELVLNRDAAATDTPEPAICSPLDKKEAASRRTDQELTNRLMQLPSSILQDKEAISAAQTTSPYPTVTKPLPNRHESGIETQNRCDIKPFRLSDDRHPAPRQLSARTPHSPGLEASSKPSIPPIRLSQPTAPEDPDDAHLTPTLDLTPEPLDRTTRLPTAELAHAALMPALNTQPLIGQNVLVENVTGEAVGPFNERYRSLFATFLVNTGTSLHREATEQTGKEVWEKLWQNSRGRRYTHLRECNLLALYLEPRQELRLKTAREAFKREAIDYTEVLGSLIWHRLAHGLATWVFTPRRLDDPDFITVYGSTLAGLLGTSFTPIRFGERSAAPVTRRHPLNPGPLRWLDGRPPPVFVHPETGLIAVPGEPDPRPRAATKAAVDHPTPPAPRTTQPAQTADDAASPYAAQMARARQEYARLRCRNTAPPQAPNLPTTTVHSVPAEPSRGRSSRPISPDAPLPRPPVRRTFHHDYTLPAPTLISIPAQMALSGG